MAYLLKIKDAEELEQKIESKDKELSLEIVRVILDNLKTTKRFINILEIHIESSGTVIDLTADRNNFIPTLEKNLNVLVFHEEYEICAQIKDALIYLNHHEKDLAS